MCVCVWVCREREGVKYYNSRGKQEKTTVTLYWAKTVQIRQQEMIYKKLLINWTSLKLRTSALSNTQLRELKGKSWKKIIA